jgi:AcrR family transcriptional regulator
MVLYNTFLYLPFKASRLRKSPTTEPTAVAKTVASRPAGAATRARILDLAEQLFAEWGFSGVSIRDIAALGQLNVGVIVYYFKTKAALYAEVYRRLVEPVMEERRQLIQGVLQGPNRYDVTKIIEAALRPVFEHSRKYPNYRLLAGRSTTDPTPEVRAAIDATYVPEKSVFSKALRDACPELSHDEFYWRYYCLHGAVQYILADIGRIQQVAGQNFDTSDPQTVLSFVVPYLAGGMLLPPTHRN